jgi:hypothetical protein
VVLYEDLPYANAGGGDHVRALGRRPDLVLRRESMPVDLRAKEQAVRLYGSQLLELLPRWTNKFAASFDPVERYWIVTPRGSSRQPGSADIERSSAN